MYSAHLTYVHSSVLANHTDKHVGDRDGGQNLSFKKNEGTVKHSQTGPNYKQNKINTDQHRDRAGNSASGIAEPSHPNCLAVSPTRIRVSDQTLPWSDLSISPGMHTAKPVPRTALGQWKSLTLRAILALQSASAWDTVDSVDSVDSVARQ